jgi:hypothetical protein
MRKLLLLAALALVAGLMALQNGPAQAATTHWVNDDDPTPPSVPPGTSCNNPGYASVQEAVTEADPGDTIRVCAGPYPENVTITKSLRVTGDGAGVTTVTGLSGTPGPIFDVTSAGHVTIEKLTVDGMSAQAGGVVWGIRYDSTNGVIKNVAVLNIRDETGGSQGLGIRIQSDLGPANVRIENNLVQNFTRGGISGNRTDGIGSIANVFIPVTTVPPHPSLSPAPGERRR